MSLPLDSVVARACSREQRARLAFTARAWVLAIPVEVSLASVGLATYKVEIVPQGALPRTSSGKPQRRKTRQMFLDGTLPKARGVQNTEGESQDATSA